MLTIKKTRNGLSYKGHRQSAQWAVYSGGKRIGEVWSYDSFGGRKTYAAVTADRQLIIPYHCRTIAELRQKLAQVSWAVN